jgi:hypothetical protein
MKYSRQYLFSCMMNSYLDFQGLKLTNDDLDECLNIYDSLFEKFMITCIDLTENQLQNYDCRKIIKVFPQLKFMYVSDLDSIDSTFIQNINVMIK